MLPPLALPVQEASEPPKAEPTFNKVEGSSMESEFERFPSHRTFDRDAELPTDTTTSWRPGS